MTTPRTQPTHQRRVDRIAQEAAAQVAADSPVEEEVIVTVEEVPPTGRSSSGAALSPQRYMETMVALADANTMFVQRVLGAQARFATRLTSAVLPRAR